MATVRRAAVYEIVLAIRDDLADYLEWDASRILVVAGDVDVPYRTGDQDIVLRVQGERPDREAIDSGGRVTNRRTRELDVEVRTRMLLDPSDQDLERLTSSSAGHLLLEDDVCEALEVLFTFDDAGDALVGQPNRLQQLSKPQRDRDNPQWVTSTWTVEVLYDRDLDLTRGV